MSLRSDSKLVVMQYAGTWKISTPHLVPLRKRAVTIGQTFEECEIVWVPRDQNQEADALANYALDNGDRVWDAEMDE